MMLLLNQVIKFSQHEREKKKILDIEAFNTLVIVTSEQWTSHGCILKQEILIFPRIRGGGEYFERCP